MEFLAWVTPELSRAEWTVHTIIFVINIALLFLAKPLLNLVKVDDSNKITIRIFQSVNILIFTLHLIDVVLLRASDHYEHFFIKFGLSLATVYTALYIYNLMGYLSRKRFGREKTIDENTVFIDTYSSRLVSLLSLIFIVVTAIYTLIKIWGADSMLETTGIFGIIVAFLAFTSGTWAPDVMSGLIVLNTRILEDGDLVIVDGYPDEYIISKVTLIYIVLYNIRNNQRTLIRNSQFIKTKIDNLSRVASTDGLRHEIVYNIAYPELKSHTADERAEELRRFKSRIDKIFTNAFENSCNDKTTKINPDKPFKWALTSTGDFALQYSLWFFISRLPNTKVTSSVRTHLLGSIHAVNENVFFVSEIEGISLSTPRLCKVELEQIGSSTITAGL
ncbi:Small-conductance mechanosensitive channel [Alteromonadaceae bacterium Bs31]|nr:Small-conductance mechanosensitive channel [Alteromonadaceae bacterium Bs31]